MLSSDDSINSSSLKEDGDDDITAEPTTTTPPKLTKQEEILQNALNIQPETPQEKAEREEKTRLLEEKESKRKQTNIAIAGLSFVAAVANYVYQFTHPVTDVQLLYAMSQSSAPLTEIGSNGKPTVVDFWAPWCENCKRSASTLASIEKEYGASVNFVTVNGDDANNWPLIERFQVDAIPHLALITKDGYVETALIGPVPRSVLKADLDVLIGEEETAVSTPVAISTSTIVEGEERQTETRVKTDLPYAMFDAFKGNEGKRKIQFIEEL